MVGVARCYPSFPSVLTRAAQMGRSVTLVTYGMAERMLTPDDQAGLVEGFEKLEVEKIGAGRHEQIHAMMAELLAGTPTVPRLS